MNTGPNNAPSDFSGGILIHDYAGHPFQYDLSKQLASLGYVVVHGYFGGDKGPKAKFELQDSDPSTLEIAKFDIDGEYSKSTYLSRRRNDLNYGRVVAQWIIDRKPSVVVSGNAPSEVQEHIYQACEQEGVKFVSWVQDFYGLAVEMVLRKRIPCLGIPVSWYYKHLDKRHLHGSIANILISEAFLPQLKKWGISEDKNHVIPNWGSLDEIQQKEKVNPWSTEHSIEKKFVFLYTGTLGIKHTPELILELCHEFEADKDVVIVVAGQGRGYDWLKKEVESRRPVNLTLLPLQPFEVFQDVLASADVTVALLEEDAGAYAVPSKVLNYMCAGKPVLISSPLNNQAAEVVSKNRIGIATSCGNPTEFRKAAREMFKSSAVLTEFSQNSRHYAEQNFDIKLIANKFIQVINR